MIYGDIVKHARRLIHTYACSRHLIIIVREDLISFHQTLIHLMFYIKIHYNIHLEFGLIKETYCSHLLKIRKNTDTSVQIYLHVSKNELCNDITFKTQSITTKNHQPMYPSVVTKWKNMKN